MTQLITEAEASRNISAKEGLLELLQLLADSKVRGPEAET